MQTSNLSNQSAFIRFSVGTAMTAMGIAKYSRNPGCFRARGMIVLGAMKMAEGVFKYCPTKALMQNSMQSSVQNVFTPENPNMAKIIQDFAKIVSSGNTASNNQQNGQSGSSTGQSTQNSSTSQNAGNTNNKNGNVVSDVVNAVASVANSSTTGTNGTNASVNANQNTNASQKNNTNKDSSNSTKSQTNSSQKNQPTSATNPS